METGKTKDKTETCPYMVVPFTPHCPISSCSYPIGQLTNSADRQEVAEKGNWPTAPSGGTTHTTPERAQTATESQTRHLEPDNDNKI